MHDVHFVAKPCIKFNLSSLYLVKMYRFFVLFLNEPQSSSRAPLILYFQIHGNNRFYCLLDLFIAIVFIFSYFTDFTTFSFTIHSINKSY